MILIPKLSFAIAIVSLFRLAQTNDKATITFLHTIGGMDQGRTAGHVTDLWMTTFIKSDANHAFMRGGLVRDRLVQICNNRLRDILLIQVLEIPSKFDEMSQEYQGCTVVTNFGLPTVGEVVLHTPGLTPGLTPGPSYASDASKAVLTLLRMVGAHLVGHDDRQIDVESAKRLARLRATDPKENPAGQTICTGIDEARNRNQRAKQLAEELAQACEYIQLALALIDAQL